MSEPTTATGKLLATPYYNGGYPLHPEMVMDIEAEARRAALDEAIAAAEGLSLDPDALYDADTVIGYVIDALTRLRDGASPDSPEVR